MKQVDRDDRYMGWGEGKRVIFLTQTMDHLQRNHAYDTIYWFIHPFKIYIHIFLTMKTNCVVFCI
jgi:hypothetical protein